MIAEEYLSRSRLFRRLKSGPHGQLVELYTAHLVRDELAGHGTWRCLNLVGDLLSWIKSSRLKLADLDERVPNDTLGTEAGKQSHPAGRPGGAEAIAVGAARGGHDRAGGCCRRSRRRTRYFAEFDDYLRGERGLAPRTIVRHLPFIRRFLREVCAAGASDLGKISQGPSPATSSATPGIGARHPGRRCAGRCAHFSDTSIIRV